jgi:hypothetical protein
MARACCCAFAALSLVACAPAPVAIDLDPGAVRGSGVFALFLERVGLAPEAVEVVAFSAGDLVGAGALRPLSLDGPAGGRILHALILEYAQPLSAYGLSAGPIAQALAGAPSRTLPFEGGEERILSAGTDTGWRPLAVLEIA